MSASDPDTRLAKSSAVQSSAVGSSVAQRKGAARQEVVDASPTNDAPAERSVRRPEAADRTGWLAPNSILVKTHAFMVKCASVYSVFLILIMIPWVQDQFIYMHNARWPWNANFSAPDLFGLEVGRARNVPLVTRDNVTLGAWHILPPVYYDAIATHHELEQGEFYPVGLYDAALGSFPTVIFLHGNAASRAVNFRVDLYRDIAKQFQANVVVIDYRGFADSAGRPSEAGLVLDARAAWDFVQDTRCHLDLNPDKVGLLPGSGITIFGQSLGTAVAAQLVRNLTLERTPPQGVVLAAPFASMREVVTGYGLLGLPIFGPLELLPAGTVLLNKVVHATWNTSAALQDTLTQLPWLPETDFPQIVLTHAADDNVIPAQHSEWILERAILTAGADQLPSMPYDSLAAVPKFGPRAKAAMDRFDQYIRAVHQLKEHATVTENVPGVAAHGGDAQVETLYVPHAFASDSDENENDRAYQSTVSLIRSAQGGHEYIAPGVLALAAKLIGIKL